MTSLMTYPTATSLFWAGMAWLAAGGVYWLATRRGPAPPPAWVAIVVLGCAGLLPAAGYLRSFTPYHILVTVEGPPGVSIDGAKIWSSVQDDATRVAGGWRIDVPAELVAGDRNVMVWAALDPADFTHSQVVTLGNDHQPKVTVRITGDLSAQVRGWVRNRDGLAVNGAVVSLAGRPASAVVTQMDGDFSVPVYAQKGDEVELQVAANRRLKIVWATAGDKSLVVAVDGP